MNRGSRALREFVHRQSPAAGMGVVTAIDEVAKSLTINTNTASLEDQVLLKGVRWFEPYIPAEDDLVGYIGIESGWWVLGKNSYDLRQSTSVNGQATVKPTEIWNIEVEPADNWFFYYPDTALARVGTILDDPMFPHLSPARWAMINFDPAAMDLPSGAIIESAYITAVVQQETGNESITSLRMGNHSYPSIPSSPQIGEPVIYNDEWVDAPYVEVKPRQGQFQIPSPVIAALAAGAAKGICLIPPPSVYQSFTLGSIELVITFTSTL